MSRERERERERVTLPSTVSRALTSLLKIEEIDKLNLFGVVDKTELKDVSFLSKHALL